MYVFIPCLYCTIFSHLSVGRRTSCRPSCSRRAYGWLYVLHDPLHICTSYGCWPVFAFYPSDSPIVVVGFLPSSVLPQGGDNVIFLAADVYWIL
ncbi:hypothetical protein GDO78_006597 [Eleutherodactylus coqui]|uniref:Uncharacterized protein n=1 Tax=Eleutherodactylus coqui TaxID=57060 RepID=A0A8J6KC64_ELECQ|nr:hypothetical protein GDO78_006597 [Eleutherodactylus coqui]